MSTDLKGLRCLVLGGSGFIGKALCAALVGEGAAVRAYSRDPFVSDGAADLWWQGVEWLEGDFSDRESLGKSLQGIQVVFHLISTTLPASSNRDVSFDLTSNVLATVHMLEAAKHSGVQKVIFVSSGGTVYGIPKKVPVAEDHETNPICAYGVHKLTIEKYLHLYSHLWNLRYGVLRASNPYGVGQPMDRPQGVIANFLQKAIQRTPVEIWGDGSVTRDYIYIDDLIRACLLFAAYEGPYRVMNVGAGKGYSLLQVISVIETVVGEPIRVNFQEARSFDVPVNILDTSRATSELGWRPTIDLETGVRLFFEKTKRG